MLKAVLFDFNGVIINDEPIHERLLEQLLIEENLRLKRGEFRQVCLGRSDRACITELLGRRGRVVTEAYLLQLLQRKAQAYQREIEAMETLPIYRGLAEFVSQMQAQKLKLALVTGALRSEAELVLRRAGLLEPFEVVVAGDDLTTSKPAPDGYLLAIERLNQLYPGLNLQPRECFAIEDTFAGLQAARQAGVPVAGVANTYPLHLLQRWADWAVDRLADLEWDRVQQIYLETAVQQKAG